MLNAVVTIFALISFVAVSTQVLSYVRHKNQHP